MNVALLLSGGIGSRISTDVPKQYVRINNRMLITFALEPLLKSPYIDIVQIVAGHEWREAILADAKRAGLDTRKIADFTIAGQNRQNSILNGLQDILHRLESGQGNSNNTDTVLIHDAARPLLNGKQIEECYTALAGHDGVMPVLPMKDTVYLSRDGVQVNELLERSHVYAGQAPELFLIKKYYQANTALGPDYILKINGSAEPAILAGLDIVMIPGDERNFKVTTEADFERFQEILHEMQEGNGR